MRKLPDCRLRKSRGREQGEPCLDAPRRQGRRVVRDGAVVLERPRRIPVRHVELEVIGRHGVVRVGNVRILVRVAVHHELAALGQHVLECLHHGRRAREGRRDRDAAIVVAIRIQVEGDGRDAEWRLLRRQVVRHAAELARVVRRVDVLDPHERSMSGRRRRGEHIEQDVAQRQVSILWTDVRERVLPDVGQVPALDRPRYRGPVRAGGHGQRGRSRAHGRVRHDARAVRGVACQRHTFVGDRRDRGRVEDVGHEVVRGRKRRVRVDELPDVVVDPEYGPTLRLDVRQERRGNGLVEGRPHVDHGGVAVHVPGHVLLDRLALHVPK